MLTAAAGVTCVPGARLLRKLQTSPSPAQPGTGTAAACPFQAHTHNPATAPLRPPLLLLAAPLHNFPTSAQGACPILPPQHGPSAATMPALCHREEPTNHTNPSNFMPACYFANFKGSVLSSPLPPPSPLPVCPCQCASIATAVVTNRGPWSALCLLPVASTSLVLPMHSLLAHNCNCPTLHSQRAAATSAAAIERHELCARGCRLGRWG